MSFINLMSTAKIIIQVNQIQQKELKILPSPGNLRDQGNQKIPNVM